MATMTKEQEAEWIAGTRQLPYDRRNWPVVRGFAAVTVTLLVVSLPADLVLGSRALTAACWIGATVAGAAMFAWFGDSRRFVERSPISHP